MSTKLNTAYPVDKATAQISAKSIKSANLKVGAKLIFTGFGPARNLPDGTPNDSVRFSHEGENLNIPMREYLKFRTPEGDSMMNNEGGDEIQIFNELTIAGATPRKDSEGNLVYSSQHYKLAKEMFSTKAGSMEYDYATMIEAGFKPGVESAIKEGKIHPVQDYIVTVG